MRITNRLFHRSLTIPVAGLMLAACGGSDDSGPDAGGPPGGQIITSIAGGSFTPYAAYQSQPIRGKAHLARMLDGTTKVEVHVEGLTPGTQYPVHVHALPCEVDSAGGHYKIDPTVADTQESNEIWPVFTADDKGIGRASVTASHAARMDAQAVVVHDPNAEGAKMACANLLPGPAATVTLQGTFAPYASAADIDNQIAGTASATITPAGTAAGVQVVLNVTGLDQANTYEAHIHSLPCAVNDAGGHYKIDPTIADTVVANEIWPTLQPDASGASQSNELFTHVPRMDAQAVVIHRMDTASGTAPRVACADLVRGSYPDFETAGTAVVLQDGMDLGYSALSATASIVRRKDGSTRATLQASGLMASQVYPVHVHAQSCALENGGPHYKLDASVTDTVETNELWLNITADASGNGSAEIEADHLARPEAQAIVIHAAEDNTKRLACIDLQ